MCGIVAYLAFNGPPVDRSLLREMNETQALRGPDYRAEVIVNNGLIGLGHTRLSIIDLSELGHQPMATSDQLHWIVFNGEIYNFLSLRKELIDSGDRFASRSDTEVVLKALRRWGTDALEKIEGIFAFVYVDLKKGYSLAARDRVGVKPLAYYLSGSMICFASTISPLKMVPDFTGEIDPIARFEMLISKYVSAPRTIYRQIKKLEPGTWMKISFSGNISKGRFWSVHSCITKSETGNKQKIGLQSAKISLKAAIKEAVRRQLTADVPVGVFLSSGVDSSLVAAMACQEVSGLKTFTVGYNIKAYDESGPAMETARFLGTDHHEMTVTPEEVIAVATSISEAYDEPFGDASAIPTFLISRFARRTVKVVLSGDGGDEQFFGYPRYHRLALLNRVIPTGRLGLDKLISWFDRANPRSIILHALTALLGCAREHNQYTHYLLDNYSRLSELAGAGKESTLWDTGLAEKNSKGFDLTDNDLESGMMLADFLNYLPDDCLTKVDRASMANSLEVRVPLLDEHVLNQSFSIPVSMKWHRLNSKYILKSVLSDYLPSKFINRPKKGFGIPLDRWMFNEMKDYTMGLLTRTNILKADLNPDGVQKIMDHHQSGRYDHQYFLWPLCCYLSWYLKQS